MYNTVRKILEDGGKCLLVENGKPLGIILTVEEFEKLVNQNTKKSESQDNILITAADSKPSVKPPEIKTILAQTNEPPAVEFDDLNLDDLGLDDLPF